MFANPANFNAYLVTISWSDERKCLVFEEKSRSMENTGRRARSIFRSAPPT